MLKAIVFDFDGVIVDSEPLHFRAFLQAGVSLGVTLDYRDYVDRLIGFDDRDVCRVLLARAAGAPATSGPEAYHGDPEAVAALGRAKAAAFAGIVRGGAAPIEGALDLLDALGERMPLAIASGAIRADIDPVLEALGLVGRFNPVVTADDVARSKPHPETYALAVSGLATREPSMDIRAADCLAIEDTPAGADAARAAGLAVLGITTSVPAELLTATDHVVATFVGLSADQLAAWFA